MKEFESVEEISELLQLLVKNSSTMFGLTDEENMRARELIFTTEADKEKPCFLCNEPSVCDTNLCRGHAFYCLATRK